MLEEWFFNNKNNPYASYRNKIELSKKTNLTVNQVSKWLVKRRKKNKEQYNGKSRLSLDAKLILKNHFETISANPNKEQLNKLSNSLDISEKKISQWFAKKRFEKKN